MTADFHAHILPSCDHGSRSLAESLAQLSLAREARVDTVCATPHFYPQRENVGRFLKRRADSFNSLKPHLNECLPKVLLGAEVLVFPGLEKMEELPSLCLEGTNFLLLEMPFTSWNERHLQTVYEIDSRPDITVVLAHIDRYNKKDAELLLREDVKAQVNASALARPFFRRKGYLFDWIEDGSVIAMGSDIHGVSKAYKSFSKAQKKLGSDFENLNPVKETAFI